MADDARLRREAAAWLARLRGPDGERDRDRFEAWRSATPEHAAAYAKVERHWQRSGVIAGSRLRYSAALSKPWWRAFDTAGGRLAFGGAAAVAMVFGAWHLPRSPGVGGPIRVASMVGQLRTIRLDDGSRVTLDTDTAISIDFSPSERRLVLDHGRARFTVAHDAHRPFSVASGKLLVVAHGTVFDVDARPGAAEVTLIEGIVDVVAQPDRGPARRVALAAGTKVTVATGTTRITAPRPAPSAVGTWTSGMLTFEATPLDRVIADANRYTSGKLILGDPALSGLRVTGAFPATATEELAASLAHMFSLRASPRPWGDILLTPTASTPRGVEGG